MELEEQSIFYEEANLTSPRYVKKKKERKSTTELYGYEMTSRLAVPYYIFVEAFDAVSQGFGAKATQIKWLVVVGPITTETGSVKGLILLSFPTSTLVLSIELPCTLLGTSPLLLYATTKTIAARQTAGPRNPKTV